MIGSSRSAKLAALGFLLVAGLVVGGLAWATVASVQLERARNEAATRADHSRRLRQALWRIDPLVMNVFAKEASRPYWHYSAYYYPSKVLLTSGEELTGSVVEPSPLLDSRNAEEWILLHFQVSPQAGWNSPQIPSPDAWWVTGEDVDPSEAAARTRLLASLESAYTPDAIAAMVGGAEAAARAASRWIIGEGRANTLGERRVAQAPSRSPSKQQREAARTDFRHRGRQTLYIQRAIRPPQKCDPADIAFNNLQNVFTAEYADENPAHVDFVNVTVSPMTALWIRLPGRDDPLLAMVRTVEAEGNRVNQGFVVDWPKLSRLLLDRVSDLFEQVEFELLEPGTLHEPESTMTALPAKLVTGPATGRLAPVTAAAGWWGRLDLTLLFAWGFALLALAAIGLGVRSLLTLTERRSQFAYAVTHELRTPLTTLCLYTDMLASGLAPEGKRGEYVETLRNESQRLSDLVSGILEYSRVENRTLRLEMRAISVAELLKAVAEQYEPRCRQGGVELLIRTNGTDGVSLRTDPQLVVQILGNLIDNACKYGRGGETPCVTLGASVSQDEISLSISDTGPGIARSDRRHIFKPFRRGRGGGGAAKGGGIGLGLALARSWATLLGGRLELVPTRTGHGARFRLSLPVRG